MDKVFDWQIPMWDHKHYKDLKRELRSMQMLKDNLPAEGSELLKGVIDDQMMTLNDYMRARFYVADRLNP